MKRQWPLGSEVKRKELTGGAMLYDASRAGNLLPAWFDPNYWKERNELDGEAMGRGTVYFVRHGAGMVLRHYRRGGLMARLMRDRYLWRGEQETRAFSEWQLTYHLHRAGLPVPAPVAARYRHEGMAYTADLITERIANSESLAERLRTRSLSILGWIAIGRCIRSFHDLGVCHADLNAHNILLTTEGGVYLIDFDRGRLMKPGLWCDGNLVRLRRSLEKVTYALPSDRISEADWHGLLDGYRQPSNKPLTPPPPLPPASDAPAPAPAAAPAAAATPTPTPTPTAASTPAPAAAPDFTLAPPPGG